MNHENPETGFHRMEFNQNERDRYTYLSLTELADERKDIEVALDTIRAKYDALVAYRKANYEKMD